MRTKSDGVEVLLYVLVASGLGALAMAMFGGIKVSKEKVPGERPSSGIFSPLGELDAAKRSSRARDCTNNLRQLGTYVVMYTAKYGGDRHYPGPGVKLLTDLFTLPSPGQAIARGNEALLICKETGDSHDLDRILRGDSGCTSYECTSTQITGATDPAMPIAWDKTPLHEGKRNVLYFSGSVRGMTETEFQEAVRETPR